MKKILVLLMVLLCAAACSALEITPAGDRGFDIRAAAYTASVSPDTGNLSSLKFGGEEFLENTMGEYYSAYFFTPANGQLAAASAVREGSKITSTTPGVGTAVYTFDEDSVTIEAACTGEESVPFYMLLHHDIIAAFNGSGTSFKYASAFSPGEYDWAKGAAAMKT
ncbi:MAG: hypothetical protein J5758_04345, partial [Abditibacteriota bacterium]|nr:hypothetical protein [Abditibacteriota bacterium]